jgi:putative ATP-dependent endonuclease of the OLD family
VALASWSNSEPCSKMLPVAAEEGIAMKIRSIRIEGFRGFRDETINVNSYTCFVGPNGAGKSTVLAALNLFFQERGAASTDVTRLADEDYFRRTTVNPIRVTVTFRDLTEGARADFAAYVRQNELVVTAEAAFDATAGFGTVKHYGQRLGLAGFRAFFEAEKAGAKAPELAEIYGRLQEQFAGLPAARSKDEKINALHEYEGARPEQCELIPSADNFYGIGGTGMLARFVQWVYVPAVKDAGEEGQEAKNTALGKLIARVVRSRADFEAEVETLRTETLGRYQALLGDHQASLVELAQSLQTRLGSWAHPNVRLEMGWLSDPHKAVVLQQPVASIKTGDGDFLGSLSRMGHGLQRSYLLALLQELAASEMPNAPTLILGCEEPELYQHPPQARHLADVFDELAVGNNQVLVTTHSPLFVNGGGIEDARLIRQLNGGCRVSALTFESLCARIRIALGQDPLRPIDGLVAKIHQALQPGIAEMFFARIPVLVEGLEDVAYITTELHLSNLWRDFRRLGCQLVPVNGKDKLIQPLAMAAELGLPHFLVFDADGDTARADHRAKHERDNQALLRLLGAALPPFPPNAVIGSNYAIWATNLGTVVRDDFGAQYEPLVNATRARYGHEGGLEKHDLFIADWISSGRGAGYTSPTLQRLCTAIVDYARTV